MKIKFRFRVKAMVMLMVQFTDGVWFNITVMITVSVTKLFMFNFRHFSMGCI